MSKSTCPCEQIYASATSNGSAITISGDLVTANASATASSPVSYADALSIATKDAQQLANNYAQHDADVIGQTLTIINSRSLIPSTTGITVGSKTAPYSQVYTAKGVVLSSNSIGNEVILTGSKDKLYANGAQVYTSANPQGSEEDDKNTAYGLDALQNNTTASGNTAIGYESLQNNTLGGDNTAVGDESLKANTTGFYNTGMGALALNTNTTGSYNTAIGFISSLLNKTGSYNTAIGNRSLQNTTGSYNTAVGNNADVAGDNLTNSTSVGNGAVCGASNQITLGDSAVTSLVCAGSATLNGVTIGKGAGGIASNIAIGEDALSNNITGSYNTANGKASLQSNTTGYNNTAVGTESLQSNTTGNYNTSVGSDSLKTNTTGVSNTAIGDESLRANTTGNCNTAMGDEAMSYNTTGSFNTAIGFISSSGNKTGSYNTAIGSQSLINVTGSYNTAVGYNTDVEGSDSTNSTSVGNGAICGASNQITLGNSAVTVLRCQATTITSLSDLRDKKDIETLESSLEFIEKLNPVRFNWNMRDGGKVDIPEIGFIAQDLQQVQLDTGMKIPNLVCHVNPKKLEASYSTLLPLLVKSIQELSQDNKRLHAQIQELTAKITK